jgi:hypothetical protein
VDACSGGDADISGGVEVLAGAVILALLLWLVR